MKKDLLLQLKQKLKKEKSALEKQLSGFAKKDPKLKGDWDSKFPHFNGGVGGQSLEEAADEVEEYATRLPIEYSLELRLRDVNLALEKIKKGNYGKCDKCGKQISEEKLKVYPAARFCSDCQRSNAG